MRYYEENRRYYPESPDRAQEFPKPVPSFNAGAKTPLLGLSNPNRCTTEPLLINLETGLPIPPRDLTGKPQPIKHKRPEGFCTSCRETKAKTEFYSHTKHNCKDCIRTRCRINTGRK